MCRRTIISIWVTLLAPNRLVSLDSTSLQDLDGCFVHLLSGGTKPGKETYKEVEIIVNKINI